MKTKFYDPPSGWRYGFPRAVPKEVISGVKSTRQWLKECGYPEKDLDFALAYMRTWEE